MDEAAALDEAAMLAATEFGETWLGAFALDGEEPMLELEVLAEASEDEAEFWLTPKRPFQLNDIVRECRSGSKNRSIQWKSSWCRWELRVRPETHLRCAETAMAWIVCSC